MHSHWQQQGSEPLFPDMLWSRPENKFHAGKLLIIGGTGQGFAGAAETYAAAEKAGIGTIRVLLPASLQRTVAKLFPAAEFAPSTPSGSFGMTALAELLDAARWADGVLIAGDTGHNSETTRLFEAFLGGNKLSTRHPELVSGSPGHAEEMLKQVQHDSCMVTLCGDVIDSFMTNPSVILDRPETTLVLTFDQLQKLGTASHFTQAFTSDMGLLQLVERLNEFNKLHTAHLVIIYESTIAVAVNGRISTTQIAEQSTTQLAAHAATWWLQNPAKPYEALTTSVFVR